MSKTTAQTIKELQAQLKELQAQVPTKKINNVTVKLGEKGNILFYGLQRFPVSLYANQVEKLAAIFDSEELKQFMIANQDKLARKDQVVAE